MCDLRPSWLTAHATHGSVFRDAYARPARNMKGANADTRRSPQEPTTHHLAPSRGRTYGAPGHEAMKASYDDTGGSENLRERIGQT